MQGEIARLAAEIEALGPVNLAALEELAVATERKGFLDAQSADLAEAIGTIAGEVKVPLMPHPLITGGDGGAVPLLSGVGSALMRFLEAKGGAEAPPAGED